MLHISDGPPDAEKYCCSLTSPSPLGLLDKAGLIRPLNRQVRQNKVADQQARLTRSRYVRRQWQQAKRLSLTLSENTPAAAWAAVPELDQYPIERIKRYVHIRHQFQQNYNAKGTLQANAMIWREITRLKDLSSRP